MRMNQGFRERWVNQGLDVSLADIELQPALFSQIAARIVENAGCLIFEALAQKAPSVESFLDKTGYEAFVNKIHIEDFVELVGSPEEQLRDLFCQGVKAAAVLSNRLLDPGGCRILLSFDPEVSAMTLRFFRRRPGEPWGADDPGTFESEEVLIIDTPPRVAHS
jgi:hypothetical protein